VQALGPLKGGLLVNACSNLMLATAVAVAVPYCTLLAAKKESRDASASKYS
jgi:hypothetical protein